MHSLGGQGVTQEPTEAGTAAQGGGGAEWILPPEERIEEGGLLGVHKGAQELTEAAKAGQGVGGAEEENTPENNNEEDEKENKSLLGDDEVEDKTEPWSKDGSWRKCHENVDGEIG